MILILVVVDYLLLYFDGQWLPSRRRFFRINLVSCFHFVVGDLRGFNTFISKLQISDEECPDLKRRKGDIFPHDFVKNVVLLNEINHTMPVPLIVQKLTIVHVTTH